MNDNMITLLVIFIGITAIVFVSVQIFIIFIKIYQKAYTENAERNFEKMFLFFDYNKMFITNIGILLLLPILVFILSGNLFYSVLALIVVLAMPKIMVKVMAKKRIEKIVNALPDALAQISGSMRSGSTFTSAIETMVEETKGPISQEFGLLLKEQKLGISQQDALENLGERIDVEEIDLVVAAALIARDVGGNLAETFERLGDMLRRKIEMEGKIKALTSQGKMQGIVVGALPFMIILALVYVEPEGILPIFSTYLGWGFLAAILILEFLGAVFIKKIITIDI